MVLAGRKLLGSLEPQGPPEGTTRSGQQVQLGWVRQGHEAVRVSMPVLSWQGPRSQPCPRNPYCLQDCQPMLPRLSRQKQFQIPSN